MSTRHESVAQTYVQEVKVRRKPHNFVSKKSEGSGWYGCIFRKENIVLPLGCSFVFFKLGYVYKEFPVCIFSKSFMKREYLNVKCLENKNKLEQFGVPLS